MGRTTRSAKVVGEGTRRVGRVVKESIVRMRSSMDCVSASSYGVDYLAVYGILIELFIC